MPMQSEMKTKQINVRARGGVSRKISGMFTMEELKKATPRDLLDQIIERNIVSPDIVEQKTAEAIKNIVENQISDINVQFVSKDPEKSQVNSRSRQPGQDQMEDLFKRADLNEESIEEIQISAATMANGGCGVAV